MPKTASDLAETITTATEKLLDAARNEGRRDCADALAAMVTDPARFTDYLTSGSQTFTGGTAVTFTSYLPGVDPEIFKATPAFLEGIRFAVALLRDADFEF